MQSKGLSISQILVSLSAIFAGASFSACGMTFNFDGIVHDAYPCDEPDYNDYHSKRCVDWRCESGNAIPEDHCADAGTDTGSSALCQGRCVRNGPIGFDAPRPVYVGSAANYLFGCPPEIGDTGSRAFSGFHEPAQGCPTCLCDAPEGSCSTKPNALFVHPNLCAGPQTETVDFDGPPNWDGACTNVNAIPQGAECPPGSGIFCAQSIDSAELLEAVETCKPRELPVPKFTGDRPWWDKMVLACHSSVLPGECAEAAATTCLPSVPSDEPEWTYCVRRMGVHPCPSEFDSTFTEQYVAYPSNAYTDTTSCTKCTCTPSGGACFGTLHVYPDDSCSTNEIVAEPIGSGMTNCSNLPPTGEALGSKEITDVVYLPGQCEPSGGEPTGSVELHDSEAVTWCCLPTKHMADAGVDAP